MNFLTLKGKAKKEIYQYIHESMKKLPVRADGIFDELNSEAFHNNDVDALRHAYVSGVYAMEYNDLFANFLGHLNEFFNIPYSEENLKERNMDLWNNAVGRKWGLEAKNREELIKFLLEALNSGELILTPSDPRADNEIGSVINSNQEIIVIKESKSGRNEVYFDSKKMVEMTRDEFIVAIENNLYPAYEIRMIRGLKTPVSKKDNSEKNNLG